LLRPSQIIASKFPYTPTAGQQKLFDIFDKFLQPNPTNEKQALVLKGYAGTGKTTVVSAIVKALPSMKLKSVLMAPTGRAAKVMASYSRQKAFTVHKKIYKQVADPLSGILEFKRQKNLYKHTLFIVDEASMLSDEADFGGRGLLADLIEYVFEDTSNRLMLVGDVAQLPPVGQVISPGLDPDYLKSNCRLQVMDFVLTEVMRQERLSGILHNATNLRNQLSSKELSIKFITSGYKDVFKMTGERLEDGLRYAYGKYGIENSIVICKSNKNAVLYNQFIRRTIHFYENEIDAGDYLMIVRNNYTVLGEEAPAGFLANGDFVEVRKIVRFDELYGFRFAVLMLRLLDYPDQPDFEAVVMLDTLHSNNPSLTLEEYRKLYNEVSIDYEDIPTKKERVQAIKRDLYLNALQVKFAYALTCHKAQGGQWNAVFVEQGYLTEDMVDQEYLRWLYTAVTRATEELFLVNFNSRFF
jgi:tRNA A37 threonylcarbamoyladenosine biosynthesis protein TsaE